MWRVWWIVVGFYFETWRKEQKTPPSLDDSSNNKATGGTSLLPLSQNHHFRKIVQSRVARDHPERCCSHDTGSMFHLKMEIPLNLIFFYFQVRLGLKWLDQKGTWRGAACIRDRKYGAPFGIITITKQLRKVLEHANTQATLTTATASHFANSCWE